MLQRISFAVAVFAVAVFPIPLTTVRAAESQGKSVQSNVDTVVKSYLAVQKFASPPPRCLKVLPTRS